MAPRGFIFRGAWAMVRAMTRSSDPDALLPPPGTVSAADRMLRANWLSALERSVSGTPLLWPEFVARQGRSVHIVDVREPGEVVGPLGHISLLKRLGLNTRFRASTRYSAI